MDPVTEPSVAVCLTTIPSRTKMLARALMSVAAQTRRPDQVIVETDHDGAGAAATRNRAWQQAETDWVAFLDDDDEFYPQHLERLLTHQRASGADVVYPWFDLNRLGVLANHWDPIRLKGVPVLGQDYAPEELDHYNYIPITVLARRTALAAVGGFPQPGTDDWPNPTCEDWGCWVRLRNAGYTFSHLPERTWLWHHHASNTSGLPSRW